MGSRQDAILAELREHGGAMWADEMETVRKPSGPPSESISSLVRYEIIRRTYVDIPGRCSPRVYLELVE